jgi:hypothetical protein
MHATLGRVEEQKDISIYKPRGSEYPPRGRAGEIKHETAMDGGLNKDDEYIQIRIDVRDTQLLAPTPRAFVRAMCIAISMCISMYQPPYALP